MSASRGRLIALGVAMTAWLAPSAAAPQAQTPLATIVTVGGHAEIFRRSTGTWIPAVLRDDLAGGDGVRTRSGRLTLRASSAESLRLDVRSELFLAADGDSSADTGLRVRLDAGRLWLAVRSSSPDAIPIAVTAGMVTVTTRGGGLTIGMSPDGSVHIGVAHGTATATGRDWTRTLAQDQELVVPATAPPERPVALKRSKRDAEWMKWNEQQDQAGGYGARRTE